MSNEKQLKADALKDVVGKTWEEAELVFKEKYPGFSIRFNWKDGETVSGHKNINYNRLNVGLKDGIVLEKYAECIGPYGKEHMRAEWH